MSKPKLVNVTAHLGTSVRMPISICTQCGCKMDAVTCVGGESSPNPGDITMCFKCGLPLVFLEDMTLRVLTQAELLEIRRFDPETWAVFVKAQNELNKFRGER